MPPRPAAKRKAPDEPPSASKRTRKDAPPPANKRKAPNGEVVASGLVIIRDPSSRPPSQQSVRLPDASSSMSRSPPPPTKKFKASSSDPSTQPSAPPRAPSAKGKEKAPLAPVPEAEERDEDVHEGRRSVHPPGYTNHRPLPLGGHTDTFIPLEPRETPRIEANRSMRGEGGSASAGPSTPRQRRSSLSSRGKRASIGSSDPSIITTPHRSVEDKHFYRHLDFDSPDAARMSELLVWCMKRSLSLDPSERTSKHSGKDPPAPLPKLTAEEEEMLRDIVDGTIKMLRGKKIDTSVDGSERPDPRTQVKGNVQNEKNRARHVRFTTDITRLNAEMEAWNQVDRFYEKLQASFEAEAERLRADNARAKGKQRAGAEPGEWLKDAGPRLGELPAEMRAGAEDMIAIVSAPRKPRPPNPWFAEQPYKAEWLNTRVNAGAQTVSAIERDLDRRFALLSLEMQTRAQPAASSSASTAVPVPAQHDARDLLRALARVDTARPPAQVGDAARRAVREVRRVQEGGWSAGERRLTGVPPPTPRKAPPGTPRRPGTPGAKR